MTSPYPGTMEQFEAWPPERLLAIADGLRPEAVAAEADFYRSTHAVLVTVNDGLAAARGRLDGEHGTAADAARAELTRLGGLAGQAREEMAQAVRALEDHAGTVAAARSEIGWVRFGQAVAYAGAGPLESAVAKPIDAAAKWFVIDNVHRYQADSNARYAEYPVYDDPGPSTVSSGARPGSAGDPTPGGTAHAWTPPAAVPGSGGSGPYPGSPAGPGTSSPGLGIPPTASAPPGGSALPGASAVPGAPPAVPGGAAFPGSAPGAGFAPVVPVPPALGPLPGAGAARARPSAPGATTPIGRWSGGVPSGIPSGDARWRSQYAGGPLGRWSGGGPTALPREGPGATMSRSSPPGAVTAHPASPQAGRPGAMGFAGVPPSGVASEGETRTRPSWLLQDDPESVWFAGLPEHCQPVVSAEPEPGRPRT